MYIIETVELNRNLKKPIKMFFILYQICKIELKLKSQAALELKREN
jgi:hypothetical protein